MPYPTTWLLDRLTGPDGTTLQANSANWLTPPVGVNPMQIAGNAATASVNNAYNFNVWFTNYGPDCDVFATISTLPAAGIPLMLLARIINETDAATFAGYALYYHPGLIQIARLDAGAATYLTSTSLTINAGDKLWLRIIGSTLTAYHFNGTTWNQVLTTTDTTYAGAGKIGLYSYGTTVRIDDFGGGTAITTAPEVVAAVATPWDQVNSNTTTSAAIDTTGATDFRVAVVVQINSQPTVTDNKGNTLVPDGSSVPFASNSGFLWLFKPTGTVTVGTGHTFTSTLTAGYNHVGAVAFKPNGANPLTVTTFAGVEDTSSPFASPSVSPTGAALLLAFASDNRSGTGVNEWGGSSFGVLTELTSGVNYLPLALVARPVASGGTYNASFTSASDASSAAVGIISITESATSAPSIDTQPTDQTAFVGDAFTFTGAAHSNGGTGGAYQWQQNDGSSTTNVGTDSTSYGGTAASNLNGYQYRFVYTDSAGSVTSNWATLTVQQVGRPDGDITVGAWAPNSGTTLYTQIDEAIASDAEYIYTNSDSTCEVSLSALSAPVTGTRTVRYRASGSPEKKLLVSIVEGTTVVETFAVDPLVADLADYANVLSNAVTDYADARLRFAVSDATTAPSPSVAFGTIGTGVSGSTSIAVGYPASIAAGDMLVLVVTSGATNSETPGTPSGWASQGSYASTDGTFGIDTGPRRVTVFTKEAVGDESGTVTVTTTNGNTVRGTMLRFTKAHPSYTWDIAATGGNDSTSGTGFSVTGGAISLAVGDVVIVSVGQRVDSATQSAQSLTASGITFGTRTNRATVAVTTGNDHRHVIDTFAAISSGSGSVAPTWTYTASASVSGGCHFLRLREVPPTEKCRVTFTDLELPAASGSGTVHNVSNTEAATLTDGSSVIAAMGATTTEAAALSESPGAVAAMGVSTTEAVALADSLSGGLSNVVSTTEPAALNDAPSAASVITTSITEAAAAADSTSATQATGVSATEAAALASAQTVTQATGVTASEAAALTDTPSVAQATSVTITEAAALSNAQDNAGAVQSVDVIEAATLAAAHDAAQASAVTTTETAALASSQSAVQASGVTTTEAATLSSTESATQATNMTTTEVLTLVELTAAGMVSSVSLTEAATLADSAAAVSAIVASLTEAASLSSAQDGIGSMGVSVNEAAALADATGTGTGTLFTVDVSEIVTLASSTSALAAYIVSTLDAMALDSTHSVGQATAVTITEPMALVESISLGAQLIAVSQSEALALTDSAAVQKAMLGAVVEALNMASQEGATLAGTMLIAESMFLNDAVGAGAVSVLSISETMTLAEVVRWVSSLSTDPTFTASADPINRTAVAGVRVLIAKAMPGNFTAKWRK